MKYRCQCGKPDLIKHHFDNGLVMFTEPVINEDVVGNTLHFKAATMLCERCGRPICRDCYHRVLISDSGKISGYLCRVCAELDPFMPNPSISNTMETNRDQ